MGLFSKDTSHTVKPSGKDSVDMRRGSDKLAKIDRRMARLAAEDIRPRRARVDGPEPATVVTPNLPQTRNRRSMTCTTIIGGSAAAAALGAWLRWGVTPVVAAYRIGRATGRRSAPRLPWCSRRRHREELALLARTIGTLTRERDQLASDDRRTS